MPREERSYCVFEVKYIRRPGTNVWDAKTTEKPEMKALKTEAAMGTMIVRWGEETQADDKRATVHVSIECDRREDGTITMLENANRRADAEFRKRHPEAKIEHEG